MRLNNDMPSPLFAEESEPMRKGMGISYWIVRTTLDVYLQSIVVRRIGANKQTLSRLKMLNRGDYGVFYISSSELHKRSPVQEFRQPFKVTGSAIEPIPIQVASLPTNKALEYSLPIDFRSSVEKCCILDVSSNLGFIKEKGTWGSYLMQAFIRIDREDYRTIIGCIHDRGESQ